MTSKDKTITCKDCGKPFMFRLDEQNFYAEQGYAEPIRCKDCRAAKKAEGAQRQDRPSRGGPTSNRPSDRPFSRPSDRSTGRPAGRPGDRSGDRSGNREMFPVDCASCGKRTTVPFKPRDGRPVYCSDCFSKQR